MPAIAALSTEPLSLDEHVAAVTDATHGAVATFVGLVRDHDPAVEGVVTHLEYSAHPDAQAVIARIAADVEESSAVVIAVTHRTGLLAVGEAAIIAAAAAAHRAEAFDACREVVERVKRELPIWKREILESGGLLALEVDSRRAALAAEMALADGHYSDVTVRPDLAGRERILLARRA